MHNMTSEKLNVALLMGGLSAEREVSLKSGDDVHKALRQLGHRVQMVDGVSELKRLDKKSVDVVFNILHGADGEDGQLAAWLNLEGYQSTCVDFAAASISWHKNHAKAVVEKAGLYTPGSQLLNQASDLSINHGGPWIVKPATEGSSVGLFKADNEAELKQAVKSAFEVAAPILVEDFIQGIDCTVGIVGDVVLPVVSIIPRSGLYDYHAKYHSESTEYHCPAHIDECWQLDMQQAAKGACEALNVKGWCRVDFIVDKDGKGWFLEVNTTPGMTSHSLLPKAAKVYGWEYKELVAQILATGSHGLNGATDE